MADRIIKGDSGNDVVIQNNAGSRKIEVTNSGDVEVTGDVKTTTVKATNLKANDGTAGLSIADSTGRVTANEKILADDIIEKTTDHGVEIEGVLLKDNIIQTDDIHEKTSAHGVEIDGVTLKDGALSAGTIGDDVAFNAKYYLQLKDNASGSVPGETQMVHNSGTTVPAFGSGTGDTTNIVAANTNDYKLVKTGIYLIIFTVTAYQTGTSGDNLWTIEIRTNLSSPTASEGTDVLSISNANVASATSGTDFNAITCSVIHNFSTANSLINFNIDSIPNVSKFHASIALIRPT